MNSVMPPKAFRFHSYYRTIRLYMSIMITYIHRPDGKCKAYVVPIYLETIIAVWAIHKHCATFKVRKI